MGDTPWELLKSLKEFASRWLRLQSLLAGCGSNQDAQQSQGSQGSGNQVESASPSNEQITLSVEIFAEDLDYWQKKSQEDAFKKALPNVKLDIQSVKDSTELLKTLKIRQAADEMPDLFYMKPEFLYEKWIQTSSRSEACMLVYSSQRLQIIIPTLYCYYGRETNENNKQGIRLLVSCCNYSFRSHFACYCILYVFINAVQSPTKLSISCRFYLVPNKSLLVEPK